MKLREASAGETPYKSMYIRAYIHTCPPLGGQSEPRIKRAHERSGGEGVKIEGVLLEMGRSHGERKGKRKDERRKLNRRSGRVTAGKRV
jgi:hypothetical protein